MPVGHNIGTLCSGLELRLFEVLYSNKSQHMALLISKYFNHDRPRSRRVHLVSRVSTVHSPSTERVYFIASVSRHLLARRSLIPFPSGRGRSVTSAPSTSRSPSSPSQSGRLAGISPSLISLAPVAAARGKASCSCTSLDCHSPISIRCPILPLLPSLRFALSLRSDRSRLLTNHLSCLMSHARSLALPLPAPVSHSRGKREQ